MSLRILMELNLLSRNYIIKDKHIAIYIVDED